MNRRIAAVAAAALLGSLATAAPALATDRTSAPSPLGTELKYRLVTWTSDGAEMSIMAPRGWAFVLTPEGQARFNGHNRPDLLTMTYRGDGALRPQIKSKVAELQGTPGLHILKARGHGRSDAAVGELRYTWTPRKGVTRFVDYQYQGDDAYMVAGRYVDRKGLRGVLQMASSTGLCGA